MQPFFSRDLKRNMKLMQKLLNTGENSDIVIRELTALGQDCAVYYVDGMVGASLAADFVIRPLLRCPETLSGKQALDKICREVIEAPEVKRMAEPAQAVSAMMNGLCLLLIDTADEAILTDVRFYVKRGISSPKTETVVVGPHEAFTEPLRDNLTLLHRLLPTPDLICKRITVGTHVKTNVAIVSLQNACPPETTAELERRITTTNVDDVLTIGMLGQLIEDDPFAPLPQAASTERPDRAVSFLLEGQAVVLIDGSPRCLCMPVTLWHLFHAPDDTYMRWQYGSFMRFIRFFGASVALLLPALFVSIVIFHPISLPMSLLTNIIQSRSVVSISLLSEALLMLTVFDLINEAGTRIPGLLGSSFGLVSTLILGTAAVDAGLVSPLLLIVVALSGLGSYALPDYSLSFAFRMGQMALLIAGGLLGVPGICLLSVFLLLRVAGMKSLGRPYLAPRSPLRMHNPDLLLRAPVFRQRLRTWFSRPGQRLRARGPMRRFERRRK